VPKFKVDYLQILAKSKLTAANTVGATLTHICRADEVTFVDHLLNIDLF